MIDFRKVCVENSKEAHQIVILLALHFLDVAAQVVLDKKFCWRIRFAVRVTRVLDLFIDHVKAIKVVLFFKGL